MIILWFNLGFVYLCTTLARYFARPTLSWAVRPNVTLVYIALASMVVVAGLQNNIGDTVYYMHSFQLQQYSWDDVKFGKDAGFILLQIAIQSFTDDPQVLVFITALITNVLVIVTFYYYSRILELSLYVYIASGLFLVSMNGIRQFLAAAIIFAATRFLISGHWKAYIGIVLLASTIHQSALIMIPIYFIVRRRAWTWTTFGLLLLAIAVVAAYEQFSTVLFSVIENTQYGHYKSFSEGGANFLRVLVYAAPLLLAFVGRNRLRSICPYSDLMVNLSLLTLIFMILSTQNWIFARMTIYLGFYNVLLVSWICKIFVKKDQKLIYLAIICLYFLFFYFEHVITLQIVYQSHYLVW